MKALVLTKKNALPEIIEVDMPTCAQGEVLVQLKTAAMNHRDVWISKGMYAGINPPVILGSEGAGVLNGEDVIINPNINWGENEAYQSKEYTILGLPSDGTFAQYVKVGEDRVYPKPSHMTFEEAAAFPLAGMTAWRALVTKGQIKKGDNVLINGVGGGVAIMACQLALKLGANVYVTSSDQHKIDFAIELGAQGGVKYTSHNWHKQLKEISGGFDIIIDSAAGPSFQHLIKICKPGARIVIYGGTRGNMDNINPQILFWKQISIHGTSMSSDKEFEDMLAFVNLHKLKPIIHKVYDLTDFKQAFADMDQGKQLGKLIFTIKQ